MVWNTHGCFSPEFCDPEEFAIPIALKHLTKQWGFFNCLEKKTEINLIRKKRKTKVYCQCDVQAWIRSRIRSKQCSGSISQRYGSRSGSLYHQVKTVRKTLISTVLWLLLNFLSLENDVNVPCNKQNFFLSFFIGVLKANDENPDPDPDRHQNVIDPEHWLQD